jgi:glycosyltransferase involved in cell wall biosynthesis
MHRPKVTIVTNTFPPYREALFNHWAESVDLRVVVCESIPPGRLWDPGKERSVSVERIASIRLGQGGKSLIIPLALRRVVKDSDAVVIGGTWRTAAVSLKAARLARSLGKGVVWWSGDFDNYFYRERARDSKGWRLVLGAYQKFRKLFSYSVDTVLAYGQRAGEDVIKNFDIPAERVFWGTQIIYPGNLSPSDPLDQEKLKALKVGPLGLFLGYLEERKGVRQLLDAVQLLDNPSHRVIIAGEGSMASEVAKASKELPALMFVGYADPSLRTALFQVSDYLIVPSLYDPWSQAVSEAMTAGLPPAISSEVGAGDELVVDGDTGLVYPPGDAKALGDAMNRMVSNPDLMAGMGNRARERVSAFNLEYAATAFQQAVKGAISLSKQRR